MFDRRIYRVTRLASIKELARWATTPPPACTAYQYLDLIFCNVAFDDAPTCEWLVVKGSVVGGRIVGRNINVVSGIDERQFEALVHEILAGKEVDDAGPITRYADHPARACSLCA